jgi:hypothetical protein
MYGYLILSARDTAYPTLIATGDASRFPERKPHDKSFFSAPAAFCGVFQYDPSPGSRGNTPYGLDEAVSPCGFSRLKATSSTVRRILRHQAGKSN